MDWPPTLDWRWLTFFLLAPAQLQWRWMWLLCVGYMCNRGLCSEIYVLCICSGRNHWFSNGSLPAELVAPSETIALVKRHFSALRDHVANKTPHGCFLNLGHPKTNGFPYVQWIIFDEPFGNKNTKQWNGALRCVMPCCVSEVSLGKLESSKPAGKAEWFCVLKQMKTKRVRSNQRGLSFSRFHRFLQSSVNFLLVSHVGNADRNWGAKLNFWSLDSTGIVG